MKALVGGGALALLAACTVHNDKTVISPPLAPVGPAVPSSTDSPMGSLSGSATTSTTRNIWDVTPTTTSTTSTTTTTRTIGPGGGYWNDQGDPVGGGPAGANGSTGNNLTREYCEHNTDPGCPADVFISSTATAPPSSTGTTTAPPTAGLVQ